MLELTVGVVLAGAALGYVLLPIWRARRSETHTRGGDETLPLDAEMLVQRERSRLVLCPKCGPRPESQAAYCSSCGSPISRVCTHCGSEVSDRAASQCPSCKEPLSEAGGFQGAEIRTGNTRSPQ